MNIKTALCALALVFILNKADAQFSKLEYTDPQRAEFFNTTTLFVLFGRDSTKEEIKKIVKEVWTITPYKFILPQEIYNYAKDSNYSICMHYKSETPQSALPSDFGMPYTFNSQPSPDIIAINKMAEFPKPSIDAKFIPFKSKNRPEIYGILNCSKLLKKSTFFKNAYNFGEGQMIAYVPIDIMGTESNPENFIFRLRPALMQMQDAYKIVGELKFEKAVEDSLEFFYSRNASQIQAKTLYINRRYTEKTKIGWRFFTLLPEQDIQTAYPFPYKLVSAAEIKDARDRKDSTIAYLLMEVSGGFIFNTLVIDASTEKPLYAESSLGGGKTVQRITKRIQKK